MEDNNEPNNKKKMLVTSLLLVALVLLVGGIAYAMFTYSENSNDNTINTGNISMSFTEPSNAYTLTDALPMADEAAKSTLDPFEFTITSHATTKASDTEGIEIPYEINLTPLAVDEGKTAIPETSLKVYVTEGGNPVLGVTKISALQQSTVRSDSKVLFIGKHLHKENQGLISKTYKLIAWIDEKFDLSDSSTTSYQYKFKINVNSEVSALDVKTFNLKNTILGENNSNVLGVEHTISTNQPGQTPIVAGLYKSTATNDGTPTYYYKGNVDNNYVTFANQNWRIIRVNEDGTIRLILEDGINNNATYQFNPRLDKFKYMYFSNSSEESGTLGIKKTVDDWYNTNIGNNSTYNDQVVTGTFCEQAKVKYDSNYKSGSATMDVAASYTPDFKCVQDGNDKGILSMKVGLITADEVIHAGIPLRDNGTNTNTYLQKSYSWWTMSPAGFDNFVRAWDVGNYGYAYGGNVHVRGGVRLVINLNVDALAEGTGTSGDPYVIKQQ